MSRAYRISVKEALARHVQVGDAVNAQVEILPILEKERMRELLAAELEKRGFARKDTKATRSTEKGITVEVDLETGELNVTAEGHEEISLKTERVGVGDVDRGDRTALEAALRAQAQQALEAEAKIAQAELQKALTERLEGSLRDLKEEIDGVVTKVTAAALKQRAAELGTVEEVHEEANGSLTIKVRV